MTFPDLSSAAASLPAPDPATEPVRFLRHLYDVAVQAAQPSRRMAAYLPPPPRGRTLVLGAGKAGGAMAHAMEALWPVQAPLSGLVVTRYGHVPPRPDGVPARIDIVEAAHPVPDAAGEAAARRMLDLAQGLTADDLVVCLISGGGSALLTLPAEGLALEDKQRINRALLESGAGIADMNCVRKHLSRIKGGRLAAACAPARVVTLAISDVPGDDPAVIASGPTVPDDTTCGDALRILHRHRIALPPSVRAALEAGSLETPKPVEGQAPDVHLIATPRQSLEAAAAAARSAGLAVHILSDEMEGESRDVGAVHAALARSVARRGEPFARPCAILSGGETTVTVRERPPGAPRGRGGRAGEFCLGLARALQGQEGVWALAADTDGIDGVEDNAGAFVAPDTLARAARAGLRVDDHLARNDAYGFFAALGDLVVTGPTHTNVNDFRALLVL
ncbi:glycerate kinase [Paracidovorax avenae]|uniref:glycerate kinase type-2 family protein n=1 Tax=Paracidovorax avenae TaxID=80867 RepID=UPI000D178791|nr:glycerate kinase [Paracidovorax avenae]AVS80378.1 glycerate kinase [Paracidovorax avenae]AVT05263.1 glycerate kinase [Paracidovorax avenae]AVT15618.1 glycerate kinase [Paracidovorax avenae]